VQSVGCATRALQAAADPVHEAYLERAETAVAAAEHRFPEAASSREMDDQPATAAEGR